MRPTKSTFALLAALLLALLTLALAPAREGAKLLINDLFSLSESANAYIYGRLPVAAGASRLPACALLGGALAFLSAAVALSQSRLPALLALVALALGQAYFGLSLPAAAQLLLLFVLGLKLVPSRSAVQRLTLGACALAVALVVCLAFPGVHAATEAASERARDFLSGASLSEQADAAVPPEATQTRRENHLSLSTGGGGAVSERDYRLVTRAEEQISDPPWFDALKTALMLALVVLLLALPFAPFMLLGRRAGQARALREAFDDADSRRAVCAMFRHVARYWAAYFPVSEGLPFSRLPEAADMPDDYAAAYRACADTFLKAAYSDAPITQAERDGVKILLDETERLLYDEQSAFMQLKLRYRYLLR